MNARLLAELFGGADRYRALKCLFDSSGRTYGARDLAAQAGIDPGNASRWLRRWADVGLLEKSLVLNRPRYRPAKDPALTPLHQLFQQDSELVQELNARIAALGNRVEAALVFGSTASGTPRPDSDVDVLLITDMPRLEAQAQFKPVGRKLGRTIDVLAFRRADWEKAVSSGNPLVLDILGKPRIPLKGEIDAAAKA